MEKKKVGIILGIIIAIIIIGIIVVLVGKNTNSNILTFKGESTGTDDLKLTGYFEEEKLTSYEISYNIEYESSDLAQKGYDQMSNVSASSSMGIETTYELDGAKVLVKTIYKVEEMNENTINSIFKTNDATVTKEQFKNYAKEQGYK